MRRWAGLAGIAFVVLAFAAQVVQGDVPSTDTSDATERFALFYADEDNQARAAVSAILGLVGQFAFLWFVGGLWSALRTPTATTTPSIVVALGGAGFFVLGALEHLVDNIVGIILNFAEGGGYQPDPGMAITLSGLAGGIFLGAMIAAGTTALAAGLIIRQTAAFPGWLLWVGFAMAVLSLTTIPPLVLIAALLLAVWVVVISVTMIRRDDAEPAAPLGV
jgi:hypothetical protein